MLIFIVQQLKKLDGDKIDCRSERGRKLSCFETDFGKEKKTEHNRYICIFREGIWHGKLRVAVLLHEKGWVWLETQKIIIIMKVIQVIVYWNGCSESRNIINALEMRMKFIDSFAQTQSILYKVSMKLFLMYKFIIPLLYEDDKIKMLYFLLITITTFWTNNISNDNRL